MSEEIVKYDVRGSEVTLTKADIKRYLCPQATDQELYMFINMCRYQGLNPWLREAYLIKYGNSPASQVVGWHVFLTRAESNAAFDGYEWEVYDDNGLPYRSNHQTIAYCEAKVYRKDRRYPVVSRAIFSEYSTGRGPWAADKMPATMIRKVALSQALREAFTKEYSGLYTAEEMRLNPSELPTDHINVKVIGESPSDTVIQSVVQNAVPGETVEPEEYPDEPITDVTMTGEQAVALNPEPAPVVAQSVSQAFMSGFAVVKYLCDLYGPSWAKQAAADKYFGSPIKSIRDIEAIKVSNPSEYIRATSTLYKAWTTHKA